MRKKDFFKLWSCSTKKQILNQYFYDYKNLLGKKK